MPTKRKKKSASPDIPAQHQALYERYLAPFLKIADQIDPEAENPEFQILSAFESVTSYIAYIDIITDVVMDAYIRQLKRLGVEDIISFIGMLDECAQMKAENEPFVLDEGTLLVVPHEHFLNSDLVEEIIEELGSDSVFKKRPFLCYYAIAIMQLSLILSEKDEDAPDEDRIARYIDIRVCLERAQFSLERFYQKEGVSHKDVASKGGRERFSKHYSAAREYTMQRHKQLRAANPSISRRKAALIIADEAAEHAAFKHMSKDNLYETIEKWLKRYSVC